VPNQLAELMVYLKQFRINSYLDVGTFYGWTCSLLTAYLLRFNPALRVIALDPQHWFSHYDVVKDILPIEYVHKTTLDFRHHRFDLAFIDGNHEYSNVRADYENVGRLAGLVAFHDCNDDYIRYCPYQSGGVPKLWGELKAENTNHREFFYHPEGKNVMGIGVVSHLNDAAPAPQVVAPRSNPAPLVLEEEPTVMPYEPVVVEPMTTSIPVYSGGSLLGSR
jgi:hypothetical protein